MGTGLFWPFPIQKNPRWDPVRATEHKSTNLGPIIGRRYYKKGKMSRGQEETHDGFCQPSLVIVVGASDLFWATSSSPLTPLPLYWEGVPVRSCLVAPL